MFKNYCKTAWRSLKRNRFYSLINLAGLTLGLAIGMMILLWVRDELSFDGFHRQAKNIYRLENQVGTGNSIQIWRVTNASIAPAAKSQLPEVIDAVRVNDNYVYAFYKYQDKTFDQHKAIFADPSFFRVFDFDLIKGNKNNPFNGDASVIISQSTARKYFGTNDPIGKIITGDDKMNFIVCGIVRDFPGNSSINADMIFPMSHLNNVIHGRKEGGSLDDDWESFNFNTYLLVRPGTSIPLLAKKLKQIHLKREPADTDIVYMPFEISKMHLYKADGSPAGIETVRIFAIIAMLILGIACINYVNLSTARSMLRAKEVSLRKIVGAARMQLFMQFIIETGLLFLVASLFAIGLMYLLMPLFNEVSGKYLVVDLKDYHIWEVVLISVFSTLVISSIYPAILLSSFNPIGALKGKITSRIGDVLFRKMLVIGQFAISVALISGTIVITRQMNYIRGRALGYDKANVFSFQMRNATEHYDAIRTELAKEPGILSLTRASGNIIELGEQTGNNHWDGKLPNQTFMMYPLNVDKDFIPFFKLELVAGNNFTGAINDSAHFILNETAIRQAGIKDPIGKPFRLWNTDGTIIGVVKDFHFASMKQKIEPAIFYYNPSRNTMLYVKTTGMDLDRAIDATKAVWNRYNAGNPFSFTFLDENFENLYRSEQRSGKLVSIFAIIAIFISCLGLLGLAAYTAQVRTREIGVRKVLGSSVNGIIRLLASDFIRLVFIGIILATPVSWYLMNNWLNDFAYKMNLSWTIFVIAGIFAILIALLTISFQSVKAALANPVKSLRTE
jgi:putative ABC transport system permease protein